MNVHLNTHTKWTIVDIREETPSVYTLVLDPQGERPSFVPGQYLTVLIPGYEPREGKSYSISSTPNDPMVHITVRVMGEFSQALASLHVGDTLITTEPYGFFCPDGDTRDVAFIAGGIGIAPCMSIIRSLLEAKHPHRISLHYSNRTVCDIVFRDMLTTLTKEYQNFTVTHYITREHVDAVGYQPGRIIHCWSPESAHLPETSYFVCGGVEFTRDAWKLLRAHAIPQTAIYTEGFF